MNATVISLRRTAAGTLTALLLAISSSIGSAETVWPEGVTRINRSKQAYDRLPDQTRPFVNPLGDAKRLRVRGVVRVHDSARFTYNKRLHRVAGIDPVKPASVCTRSDGTRWACGLQSRVELQKSVTSRRTDCRILSDGAEEILVSCRQKNQDLAATLVSQGFATATPNGSLDHR